MVLKVLKEWKNKYYQTDYCQLNLRYSGEVSPETPHHHPHPSLSPLKERVREMV